MRTIIIEDKEYKVEEAITSEEKEKGLSGKKELPQDEGMLFIFDPPETVSMWMRNTSIPLDIIFIDEDYNVIKVHQGEPNDETPIVVENTAYVLEVNKDSGVKEGDFIDLGEDNPVMKVLAQDGSVQMELWGGERIFSRKNTVVLIRKAKKADMTKEDKDYRALGKYMFKCIKTQDTQTPEYVESPK